MKKRLLSMMTLLMGMMLGMQAQTLIDYPTSKNGTSISGTTTEGTVKVHLNADAIACYTLKNGYSSDGVCNDNYIKLETEGGFKAGDVLTVAGCVNNSDESKWGTCVFFTMDAEKNVTAVKTFDNFINSRLVADDPTEQSYTLEADAEVILLGRQGNTGTNVTTIKVARGGASEGPKPAITFEAGAAERTITVGLNAAGKVSVDWGNGELVEQEATAAYDGWDNGLEFTGTPAGTVKVYGEGITYFQSFTKMTDGVVVNGITTIDVSNATTLTEIDVHNNLIASIDLTKNVALTKIDVSANQLTAVDFTANTAAKDVRVNNNKLTSFKLANGVATLYLSFNPLGKLDLSPYTTIKSLYALNCELTEANLGQSNVAKPYFSLNNNKLTKLDASAQTELSNGSLFAMNNNLTELILPEKVKTVNITGNKFDLASLYEIAQKVTTLTSASMQDMEIAETIDGNIDLSAQATLGEKNSTIKWFTEDGTELVEGTDYTVANGVYTFIKEQTAKIYATLQNTEALPKLTTAIKTTLANVAVAAAINDMKAERTRAAIFNLAGQRLDAPQKGLNIIGGKKVMMK